MKYGVLWNDLRWTEFDKPTVVGRQFIARLALVGVEGDWSV